MNTRCNRPVLTVDIGGTKIAAAIVGPNGEVVSKARGESPHSDDEGELVDTVERVAGEALSSIDAQVHDMAALGVSCAGIINTRDGIVVYSPNVAALRRTPLKAMLAERFGIPVRLGNDATLAAVGEWWFGLRRSVQDLVYVTVSTGIGGGIISGGRVLEGSCGAGGEVGHMTIDVNGPTCACGRNGCWEALGSGTALATRTVQRLDEGEPSIIGNLVGGDMTKVDAQVVSIAAMQGDELAREMIGVTAFYVGIGLGNLINIFNPSVLVIGGGLTKIGDALLGPAMATARERAYVTSACDVEIITALLGDESPLLGAATLAWDAGM